MMTKLYTATGILKQRKAEKGMTYPYVQTGKNEYILNTQEMLVWSLLNWRIVSDDEIRTLYENKIKELGISYDKTVDACIYHMAQCGVIAEGVGDTGADALYDLISELSIIPISENVLLRMVSFVSLTFFRGIPYSTTKQILLSDRRNDGEKKVMRLAKQTIFSTAEIIKCVELGKTHFESDEEILDTLYCDEHTTSENIAYEVKGSYACRHVLTDVANLYLRKQIVFGRN